MRLSILLITALTCFVAHCRQLKTKENNSEKKSYLTDRLHRARTSARKTKRAAESGLHDSDEAQLNAVAGMNRAARHFDDLGGALIPDRRGFDSLGDAAVPDRRMGRYNLINTRRDFDKLGDAVVPDRRGFDSLGDAFVPDRRAFDSLGDSLLPQRRAKWDKSAAEMKTGRGTRSFDSLGGGLVPTRRRIPFSENSLSGSSSEMKKENSNSPTQGSAAKERRTFAKSVANNNYDVDNVKADQFDSEATDNIIAKSPNRRHFDSLGGGLISLYRRDWKSAEKREREE